LAQKDRAFGSGLFGVIPADLDANRVHPVHLEVAQHIGQVLENSAAVCYGS
jgi:hypothetical protein